MKWFKQIPAREDFEKWFAVHMSRKDTAAILAHADYRDTCRWKYKDETTDSHYAAYMTGVLHVRRQYARARRHMERTAANGGARHGD